jgi:transposase
MKTCPANCLLPTKASLRFRLQRWGATHIGLCLPARPGQTPSRGSTDLRQRPVVPRMDLFPRQMVPLSALGMKVAAIAKVGFTSEDRVRDVIRNFNADGFAALYPKYQGGRPPKLTLPQRREIKKIAKSRPAEHDLPSSTWSLSKLAEFLVAEGWSTTSATRGSARCSARKGSPFNACKPGRPRPTRTTRPRRPGSSTCTRSPAGK